MQVLLDATAVWATRSLRVRRRLWGILGDLQTLQTVVAAGSWQVVDDDQDTAFLAAVRNGDESEWPVGTFVDAVDDALSHSSSADRAETAVTDETNTGDEPETEYGGVEVEDGQVVGVTADSVDPAAVEDLDVKQWSGLRRRVLEACARYQAEQGVDVSSERLLDRVIGSSNEHYMGEYGEAIEDAAASVVDDETTVNVSAIVENVRKSQLSYIDVEDMMDEPLPLSASLDEARDLLSTASTYHLMQGYDDVGQTLQRLADSDDETLATFV